MNFGMKILDSAHKYGEQVDFSLRINYIPN